MTAERELLERAVHDLKNPLAVVRASLEWLEVELTGREEALDAVRDASAASERLLGIVDDLDLLARLGVKGMPDDSVAIGSLVQSVVAARAPRLARRGITIAATGRRNGTNVAVESVQAEGASLQVPGDLRLLERALAALIDDACRGAATGAVVDVTLAEIAGSRRMVAVGVTFRGAVDAGPQVTEREVQDGSSLGVYVACRVVEAHGGSVEIISTTTLPRIVVRLPA